MPTLAQTDGRCELCKFFIVMEQGDDDGTCQRFPPTPTPNDYAFPRTTGSDWCGEFMEYDEGEG